MPKRQPRFGDVYHWSKGNAPLVMFICPTLDGEWAGNWTGYELAADSSWNEANASWIPDGVLNDKEDGWVLVETL